MNGPTITLTLSMGRYDPKAKSVCLPIDESLLREAMQSVELSDEPLSVMLASPGIWGGKGSSIQARERAFKMRDLLSEKIIQALVAELAEIFGENDKTDGFRKDELSACQLRRMGIKASKA